MLKKLDYKEQDPQNNLKVQGKSLQHHPKNLLLQ